MTTETGFVYDPENLTPSQSFCKNNKKPKSDAAVFATVVDGKLHWTQYSCHARMYSSYKNESDSKIASGYLGVWKEYGDATQRYLNDTPEAQKWLDFIIGPESPWRKLGVDRLVPIEKWGLHMPKEFFYEAVDNEQKGYLYNFMIALRLEAEFPDIVKSWVYLCDQGMSQCDAFSIAAFVRATEGGAVSFAKQGWDGAHKALTSVYTNYNDVPAGYLSPTKLRDANYAKATPASTSNKGWCLKGRSPYNDFIIAVGNSDTIKTRFSSVKSNKIETIINAFNKTLKDR